MADEEEKTYEVKDKRRVNPDGTLKDDAQPEEPAEQAAAQEPAEAAGGEEATEAEQFPGGEMPVPSVYELLQFFLGMLSEQAWYKLGLRLAPGQKEIARDLAQAKVAIDTIAFMADKIHPHISEDDRRALRAMVSDLQVNFVRQSN